MLTLNEFKTIVNVQGKPLTWAQAKPPHATASVKGIVQGTSRSPENIVNAFGINGTSIQVAVDALPVAPEKFDVFTNANGERFVVDMVDKKEARGTGAPVSFTCYSKGK